jgi:LysM repeat protein
MRKLLFVVMLFLFGIASAQGTQTVAVKVSSQIQQINGKDYYVHVVEQGQTVFSIARAYGLKYYDAVIKSDIHLLKVDDTVWLPKNENSVAAVSAKASAATDPNGVRYIRVEAGQTLYSIAREYGITVNKILDANPSLRNDVLKAGQMIKIPAGIRPTRDVTELVAQDEQRQVEQRAAEAKAAEEKRLAEQRAAEEKRLAEQRAAEEKRVAEQRAAEEKRLAEQRAAEAKAAEEKRLAEAKAAEEKRLEELRAEEKRLAEQRAAEEKRIAEQRAAEEKRIAELKAESERVAKQRAEEEKRLADLKKEEEQLRKQQAAEEKRLEEKRAAEEKRLAEQKAAETKAAEEKRLAEQKAAETKAAEEKRLAEQKAAETKAAEEKRLAEQKAAEAKAAEERRLAEQKAAEEKRLAEQKSDAVTVTSGNDIDKLTVQRKVVNPYPFSEVPNDFPLQQAPYFNFSTVSTYNYQVRDLQSKDRVCVSVVMPLNLDKISEISTSKFDIEQRGKKEYKVFEFIQFYEGILIALDELQQQGYNVVVNVVDLSSDNDADVVEAFYSHNVANSDFIIALLVKKPFAKLAELAKKHQVFVINPFSSRSDVVKDNPYVVKYMASVEGTVKGMLDIMASRYRNGHLYLVHSNNKNANSEERLFFDEFQRQLTNRKDISYTFFDWAANAKLLSTLKTTNDNVIISLYDQDKNKNTVYTSTLLNRLASQSTHIPVLMTTNNMLTAYQNIDFDQLQHLNYTTVTLGYLDFDNAKHKSFIDTYKHKFHTEPNTLYAGVAHDIMLYFVSALSQKGAEFWRNPQDFKSPAGMLFPFNLRQSSSTGGYENQSPDIYQMVNYKLLPLSTH